ncbi:gastrula zinc finger protein XlCGF26.1-like [Cydia fagiglandana]|uniref:gastrula zinc finger protein XlCGF26.1-like n=1 Tax=Cydia fagiglandana TaxID=1458189 RepID=UPI002FEE62D1
MENAHCRLCAELKPLDKLIDLQSEADKWIEIVKKLKRLNARTLGLFTDEVLPKTVCFVCVSSLDRAFEFILNVEHAQEMLNTILVRNVKKEELSDDSDREEAFLEEQAETIANSIKVKLEILESESVALSAHQGEPKKKKKTTKCRSLDSLPLSQLKLTWKDYSWTCSYCETQYKSAEELKTHSMQYHHCCNAFKCGDCNLKKQKLDSFLVHVKRHRRNLKLSCYVCHKTFTKQNQMSNHKNEHRTSEYICKGCNTCFPNLEELNEHTSIFYREKRAPRIVPPELVSDDRTCVLCKKEFKSKGSLTSHLLTHTDRKRDHTCEKCGKCFFNKQNLAGHMLLHDDTRPYKCKICKFGFKTLGQLRNHVGVHDGNKPHSCDQCGRCFRLPKQLKSHQIVHTDELPYICSYCGKSFRFKTILNQHVRQHTGIKPYSCEFCQRDFTNWPNYNKHMKRRHGMDMAKKKHTPEGLYPINPATGEVVITPETMETAEWKREMLRSRRPGRPKQGMEAEGQMPMEQMQMEPMQMEPMQIEPMNFKSEATESQNQ